MNDNDLQAIRDFVAQPHSDTGWVVFAQTAVPALLAERDALAAEVRTLRAQLDAVPYAQLYRAWHNDDNGYIVADANAIAVWLAKWKLSQPADDTPTPDAPPTAEELAQEAAYYAALAAQQQEQDSVLGNAYIGDASGDVDDDGGYCGPTLGKYGDW